METVKSLTVPVTFKHDRKLKGGDDQQSILTGYKRNFFHHCMTEAVIFAPLSQNTGEQL
jgi:hypothetical protein